MKADELVNEKSSPPISIGISFEMADDRGEDGVGHMTDQPYVVLPECRDDGIAPVSRCRIHHLSVSAGTIDAMAS